MQLLFYQGTQNSEHSICAHMCDVALRIALTFGFPFIRNAHLLWRERIYRNLIAQNEHYELCPFPRDSSFHLPNISLFYHTGVPPLNLANGNYQKSTKQSFLTRRYHSIPIICARRSNSRRPSHFVHQFHPPSHTIHVTTTNCSDEPGFNSDVPLRITLVKVEEHTLELRWLCSKAIWCRI